ncbi:MAG: 23S rRNA (adenine(2503)-C(2))-methyltransferase RlmN [Candidatus Dormibacteraeota bacterium]|uniref:Probable dual-specificity RNA methyltransferase RlmN n=1 Tax=Candidatus Aeolococcus gillhamiae TaxID=3127015 RepID=A0A2W5ZBM0_9BACT|nr:23S rRNA (adenine(2503)-C(2))-methyltransferase RlmN [Candidatus Dormibacteraeota bacterium]PZR82800.1 MAG: 23S rRNA (adenine(2503)-C(2))-methyltransferase RlmN [Candidatus Dormibacter sp. RRmetagenome_bin12]
MPRIALSTADSDTLIELLSAHGAPAFRAAQLRHAAWQPFVSGLDDIRQLPSELRSRLSDDLDFSTVTIAAESEADFGRTIKLLCRLADGQTVETVAMETPGRELSRRRSTVCVSTQVGCAVGCPFCATGRMGLRRSCTAAEVVDQVRAAARALYARGLGPVTHVVYMGMGEPLAAYDATVGSMRVLVADGGLSARRITVSTSGVVPAIHRLAVEGMGCTLAVSLHASTDELRDRLVPLNRAHPLESLVGAATGYARATGRRLTFEWCLIGGINDSVEQARGLRDIARRAHAHVNVIPMNHIDDSPWGPPDRRTELAFLTELDGAVVTVRDTRGSDTDAACGQLRAALEQRRSLRPDGTLSPPARRVAPVSSTR